MRLRRLKLSRYGLFADREIDFGPAPAGAPDLHVIYGPNEAGKSTALAGFLDLLFAFEHRTPYAFRHGHEAMRVEGELEIDGEARRFVRIRKRRGSLLDGGGNPLPEGVLANALGGMTRKTYKDTFSLDDDTLEAGGDAILRSEGDLGELLFAGGAGVADVRATLRKLRDGAEAFHKGKTRNTALNEAKKRLAAVADEKRRLDVAGPAYGRLVKERETARIAYEEAAATVAALEAARADAGRRIAALPWLSEIRRLRDELTDLESLPEPPRAWFDRIGPLLENEPRLAARIDGFEKQKARLDEKIEVLPTDEAIMAVEDGAARLDELRARYVTAEQDLPRRRETLAGFRGTVESLLRRLEKAPGTSPASLVVPAASAGALRALIESRSGIDERRKAAAAERETAAAEAARAAEAFDKTGASADAAGGEAAMERLRAALEDAQGSDWRARLDLHAAQGDRLKAEIADKLERLNPWNSDAESLARLEAPERGELEEWQSSLTASDREIERLESEKAATEAERDRQSARAGAAKAETGVADDDEAAALRSERDKAWRRHREALDAGSADAFEARMSAHDAASDLRLSHAAALARVRQAGEDLRAAEAKAKSDAGNLARAQRRRRKVADEIAARVAGLIRGGAEDMPPDIALPRLAAWAEGRADILATLAGARSEELEIGRAREDGARLRERLAAALAACGAPAPREADIEELAAAARAAVAADRESRTRADAARQRLERANAVLETRRREARRAAEDDDVWRREWTAALSRCWLGEIDPAPSGAEARQLLNDAAELETAHREHAAMAARIATMERDREAFIAEVGALSKQAGEAFDRERVLAHDGALKKRLAEEGERRKKRSELAKEIEATGKELARATAEMAEQRAESECMFAAFEVASLRAVDGKLREAKRRAEHRETLAGCETRLAEAMGAASPRDAEAALADADRDALEAKAAGIAAKLGDAAARKQAQFHALQTAGDALAAVGGGDDAARLEQQRRTTLLEIEEGAHEWLRVRLGVLAAERALDAWREAHRSSMMTNASEAFRIVSRGAYSRLESQLTDNGERLIGVPAAGGAKLVSELSKGTRFQLYLALRVAGYREFADRHGAVPFIADDILETFDDFRAEEAFRLFADMAEYGQTIYLSHHRHLCDIAREVCPSVKVHELPDAAAVA